jgi:predicted transposase/invertase (TIGR01784 family)
MKKDEVLKNVLSDNDRFRNIINNALFDGKNAIKEETLSDLNIEYDYYSEGKYNKKIRDLLKSCVLKKDDLLNYVVFGIENQIEYDKYMALRCLEYDLLEYERQIYIEKLKDFKPVLTLVIYYGKTKWKNKKLSDIIKVDKVCDALNVDKNPWKWMDDYELHLLSINELTESELNNFNLDNRQLFKTMRSLNNKEKLNILKNDNDFIKVNKDMANAISYLLNIDINIKGDDINMCKALEELKQDWKQEGILLGKAEGIAIEKESNIKTMYKNGFDEALISKALDLDIEYVKSVLNK